MLHRKIAELIKQNPNIAVTLHFLGIHFHHYSEQTLAEACEQKGLDPLRVIRHLDEAGLSKSPSPVELIDYPIDLILEYLKHHHFIFIKEKLPYIAQLIQHIDSKASQIVQEIKLIYPLFLADFVEHIYEEEDTLFSYILNLHKALYLEANFEELEMQMQKYTIQSFANGHIEHDHTLGIQELAEHYEDNDHDLNSVLFIEALKQLSADMKLHARIENEILLPKAIQLEKTVRALFGTPQELISFSVA